MNNEEVLKRIKKIQKDLILIYDRYAKEMSLVWEDLNKLKKELI